MIETEIWPNLLRECRRRGIKTVMVNGRISYRSFPRYRLVRPFIRRVLADVDRFCVQGEETARRLGNLAPTRPHDGHRQPEVRLARRRRRRAAAATGAPLLPHLAGPPVLMAGSTSRRRGTGDPRVQPPATTEPVPTRC